MSPPGAPWAGSPAVCPATTQLVHDAMEHWTPARHFLFHAEFRRRVHSALLCRHRVRAGPSGVGKIYDDPPNEVWETIFKFFLR